MNSQTIDIWIGGGKVGDLRPALEANAQQMSAGPRFRLLDRYTMSYQLHTLKQFEGVDPHVRCYTLIRLLGGEAARNPAKRRPIELPLAVFHRADELKAELEARIGKLSEEQAVGIPDQLKLIYYKKDTYVHSTVATRGYRRLRIRHISPLYR